MKTKMPTGLLIAILMGLTVPPVLAGPNPPPAQPVNPADGCGQTLPKTTDNGTREYVLTGDLACGAGQNGIIITTSNVKFHLGGHTISNPSCDHSLEMIGIFVQGGTSGVLVEGGTASGFNNGVVVSSLNDSHVIGMTVKNACLYGIAVATNVSIMVPPNKPRNSVERNVVTSSTHGVALVPARNTLVAANDLSGNVVGILVSAENASDNWIMDNIINSNTQLGVHIANGSNNHLRHNSFNWNANGIMLAHPGNSVLENKVNGSANTGISIETTGAKSTVRRNTVLGSGVTDMSDGSAACDGNVWRNNTFETDLVAGVTDGGPGAGCI